jgi:uncharacterized protein YcfL
MKKLFVLLLAVLLLAGCVSSELQTVSSDGQPVSLTYNSFWKDMDNPSMEMSGGDFKVGAAASTSSEAAQASFFQMMSNYLLLLGKVPTTQ